MSLRAFLIVGILLISKTSKIGSSSWLASSAGYAQRAQNQNQRMRSRRLGQVAEADLEIRSRFTILNDLTEVYFSPVENRGSWQFQYIQRIDTQGIHCFLSVRPASTTQLPEQYWNIEPGTKLHLSLTHLPEIGWLTEEYSSWETCVDGGSRFINKKKYAGVSWAINNHPRLSGLSCQFQTDLMQILHCSSTVMVLAVVPLFSGGYYNKYQ